MSELSERVAREHHFLEWVGTDPQCVCGEVLRGRPGPGAQRIPAHVAAMAEAAVRETIAAGIEAVRIGIDNFEHAAETIAQAQNVPFVGTKQRKIAEALAAAGLIATTPTVKPGRDAVLAALLSVEAGPSTNALADAVLAILPGKSEQEVRAEALRDAAYTLTFGSAEQCALLRKADEEAGK